MYEIFRSDCIEWLSSCRPHSLHAVCTDPPYGLIEYSSKEINKLRNGKGGVWRIPPEFDGKRRRPLPRFSVLTLIQKKAICDYFQKWATLLMPALAPGAHVLIATNPLLQSHVYYGSISAGLEPRGTIIRLYHGFRGGDRPKGAEREFPDLCVGPRGNHEPWLLFRKPISERTVAQNIRKWGLGALRMLEGEKPLPDVIPSFKTPQKERKIVDHPSLKPQHLLRIFCRALLPKGGIVLDPFMGSGSTIAACNAVGVDSVGIEMDEAYFNMARKAIPLLSSLYPGFSGQSLHIKENEKVAIEEPEQLILLEESGNYNI